MENAQVSTNSQNPYVGPRPFEQGETLYGRTYEVRQLQSLLIAERIVMLYSPSGAGKTSLLQASLMPRMTKKRFEVLPVVRVNQELPPEVTTNRYVHSVLDYLEKPLPPEEQIPLSELATLSLTEYLNRRRAAQENPKRMVLIFDQFEEILTIDPTNQAAKKEFFTQVGEALHQRWLWAVFSLREDYIAGLDPYLRPIPTRLNTTFRLELLDKEAAREAMQGPAQEKGVTFTDAAAQQLVNDLCQVRVQQRDGRIIEQPGNYVEPVQLQVVCDRLWENRFKSVQGSPPKGSKIEATHISSAGDVDTALAGYYAERVKDIATKTTGVSERLIRNWCDTKLIMANIRGQVMRGAEQSQGLDNEVIEALVDAHLVRAEDRRGVTWYELAHDRLIRPVKDDNAAWQEANLSQLQRQAALWNAQTRPDGLLLRDEALQEAIRWAETHANELEPFEQEFLEKSHEEQARTRFVRRIFIGMGVVTLIAIVATVIAIIKGVEANSLQEDAEQAEATAIAGVDQIKVVQTEARAAEQLAIERQQTLEDTLQELAAAQSGAQSVAQLQATAAAALAVVATTQADAQAAEQLALERQQTVEAALAAIPPTETPTISPTPSPTATPTATPTNTATPTDTPTNTVTPTPSPTNTLTPTPNRTATAEIRQAETDATATAAAKPSFPPPGRLVFTSNRASHIDLYSMKADGSDLKPLTTQLGQEANYAAGRIVFSKTNYPTPQPIRVFMYWIQPDGQGEQRIDDVDADNFEPTLSPDGQQVAFSSTRDNRDWEIYIMPVNHSRPAKLTCANIDPELLKWAPAWSPDGGQIAFVASKRRAGEGNTGEGNIWMMDANGENCEQLTDTPGVIDKYPDWLPTDGTEIVFVSNRDDGIFRLYRMNSDGSEQELVPNSPEQANYPAWSPDGDWFTFTVPTRQIDGRLESAIYVMTVDGDHLTNISDISNGQGDDWYSIWLPE